MSEKTFNNNKLFNSLNFDARNHFSQARYPDPQLGSYSIIAENISILI